MAVAHAHVPTVALHQPLIVVPVHVAVILQLEHTTDAARLDLLAVMACVVDPFDLHHAGEVGLCARRSGVLQELFRLIGWRLLRARRVGLHNGHEEHAARRKHHRRHPEPGAAQRRATHRRNPLNALTGAS